MNQYERLTKIIGDENLYKLSTSKVLIVGLGGVGGSACEMIVRSGVENILLLDYDIIEETNLNRQIISLNNNIGEYKTDVSEKRILNINKDCKITKYNFKLDINTINNISKDINYIIDACDDINAKVLLVKYATTNNIKIISSCGTGNKLHPELLEITNIWKTEYDPLAKAFRTALKKENINYRLPVVASKEKPIIKGVLGSSSCVPNAAGVLLASYVINDIVEDKDV